MAWLNFKQKLFLFVGLMGIGFLSLLVVAMAEINKVRVGGPLYNKLEAHAQLHQKLLLLRANLSEVRAMSTDAQYLADPDQLHNLHRKAAELSEYVNEQFKELLQVSDADIDSALASAKYTWDDFRQTNEAIFRAILSPGQPLPTRAVEMQHLRQERFTDQVDSVISTLTQRDEELEHWSDSCRRRRTRR